MKYYWIHYTTPSGGTQSDRNYQTVTKDEHPFSWFDRSLKADPYCTYALVNWREITKVEYDLFKSLNFKRAPKKCGVTKNK